MTLEEFLTKAQEDYGTYPIRCRIGILLTAELDMDDRETLWSALADPSVSNVVITKALNAVIASDNWPHKREPIAPSSVARHRRNECRCPTNSPA